jgi:flagella synthesis protein FlgN
VIDVASDADVATCLQLELGGIGTFLEILQAEQGALVEGEMERLEVLASEKARMAEQLSALAARRNRSLASRGFSTDTPGMAGWLTHSADAKTVSAWRVLQELATTAQQLNRTNGTIIATRLKHNQQALAALQGAAGAISLYGPNGQTLGLGSGWTSLRV